VNPVLPDSGEVIDPVPVKALREDEGNIRDAYHARLKI
jgi:hypothetical protein